MNVPDDLKYAQTHEWIRAEGDIGIVGVTDHAQEELSDVVFVELPEVGKVVAAGETAAVVESVKAASDIYSPVSGEIVEVNAALQNDPGLINTSPFESGWIFKLKISDPSQLEALKSPEAYREQIS
jgi:glycine cleavage system H protein